MRSISSLSLDDLRHFHQIATHRSLRRAAESLRLTPPAVTHSLARLERSLGVRLCHRGRAGFRLTPAGDLLYKATHEIFKSLQTAIDGLDGEAIFEGAVRVGVQTNLLDRHVDALVQQMLRRFPRTRISFHGGSSSEILGLVRDGELQLGIGIFLARRPVNLEFRRVSVQRHAYFVGKGHPLWNRRNLSRNDFKGHEVTWLDTEWRSTAELEAAVYGSHPRYQMVVGGHSDTIEGAVRMLLSGRFVVPLPEAFLADAPQYVRGQIRPLPFEAKIPEIPIEIAYDPRTMSAPVSYVLAEAPQNTAPGLRQMRS